MADTFNRWKLFIAYLVLFIFTITGMYIGFTQLQEIIEEQERISTRQAFSNCASNNELRLVIRGILQQAAEPQPSETETEAQNRRDRIEQLVDSIELRDCPPPPPEE